MESNVELALFKQLLLTLENSSVLVRVRLAGKHWSEFSQVILVSDNAMIVRFADEQRMIVNLNDVAEFTLDQPHLDYRPDIRYQLERWSTR